MEKTNKRKKMKERKIVCTYCKSDRIEYVPAPFQGQDTWFDVRYEQRKDGKFMAVLIGNTPEKERANVNTIDTVTMEYNDMRPWMHCLSCSAELDGFGDTEDKAVA